MQLTYRPWITTGVALAGASLIAATPAAAPLPKVEVPALQLTADFDPLGLWQEVFNTASANATAIAQDYFEAPLPVLQQSIVNQVNFLGDFLNNPGSIGSILGDIWGNGTAAALAPFSPFIPAANSDLTGSLDSAHQLLFGLISSLLPDQQSLLDFLASPASGWLLGELGTILSPTLQFINDVTGIIDAISGPTPDWTTALQDLVNIPANLTGAYLNGYGPYDLLPLLDKLGIELPSLGSFGNITALDVDLGGLLSPGGSLFNALGVEAGILVFGRPVTLLDVDGVPAGPLASLVQMTQAMSQAIGWDTVGNPLTHLTFPTLDWFSDGAQGAVASGDLVTQMSADVNTLWADLVGTI
jgi:hypothetical protein